MNLDKLEKTINESFEKKEKVNPKSDKKIIKAINETIDLVDQGKIRVANKINGNWVVNQWIKKAILLSFRVNKMTMSKGPYTTWYDKVPGKTVKWKESDWKKAGYRHVPNGVVRRGSFIAKNAVLMPSFVNLGAYVDEGTMIDTWASVGSCAQVGKNCHISPYVQIDLLYPEHVTIEDNVSIGTNSIIFAHVNIPTNMHLKKHAYPRKVEPVHIKSGAVIGPGTIIIAGVTIGKNAMTAVGSVVTQDVPDFCVVVGNPARVVKKIEH